MKRKILASVLFVLLFIPFTACTHLPEKTVPIKISAETLWDEFASDGVAATATYDGNIVAVTGVVAETAQMFMNQPCILLENGVVSIPDGIFCFFSSDFDASNYNKGETITVYGVCAVATHIAGESAPFISIEEASVLSDAPSGAE